MASVSRHHIVVQFRATLKPHCAYWGGLRGAIKWGTKAPASRIFLKTKYPVFSDGRGILCKCVCFFLVGVFSGCINTALVVASEGWDGRPRKGSRSTAGQSAFFSLHFFIEFFKLNFLMGHLFCFEKHYIFRKTYLRILIKMKYILELIINIIKIFIIIFFS